jgi:hypothetical protein
VSVRVSEREREREREGSSRGESNAAWMDPIASFCLNSGAMPVADGR